MKLPSLATGEEKKAKMAFQRKFALGLFQCDMDSLQDSHLCDMLFGSSGIHNSKSSKMTTFCKDLFDKYPDCLTCRLLVKLLWFVGVHGHEEFVVFFSPIVK